MDMNRNSNADSNPDMNAYRQFASGQPCPAVYSVEKAKLHAESFLRQLEHSEKIIQETRNLETFFHRYGYALFLVTELVRMEAYVALQGDPPAQRKEGLLAHKQEAIRNLTDRLCEKLDARVANLKNKASVDRNIICLRQEIKRYHSEMEAETIAYADTATDRLQRKYDAIFQMNQS